jgi:hypothetical protein
MTGLGSLQPPPRPAGATSAAPPPLSRVELARQKTPIGSLWQGYHARFIRTGSFFPIVHAMSGLMVLQLTVWAVRGIPEEVRSQLEGSPAKSPKPSGS